MDFFTTAWVTWKSHKRKKFFSLWISVFFPRLGLTFWFLSLTGSLETINQSLDKVFSGTYLHFFENIVACYVYVIEIQKDLSWKILSKTAYTLISESKLFSCYRKINPHPWIVLNNMWIFYIMRNGIYLK